VTNHPGWRAFSHEGYRGHANSARPAIELWQLTESAREALGQERVFQRIVALVLSELLMLGDAKHWCSCCEPSGDDARLMGTIQVIQSRAL